MTAHESLARLLRICFVFGGPIAVSGRSVEWTAGRIEIDGSAVATATNLEDAVSLALSLLS